MLRNSRLQGLVLFGVLLTLAACAPSPRSQAAQTAQVQIAATNTVVAAAHATLFADATPEPTVTAIPPTPTVAPPTSVPLPSDQDLAELKALVTAQLPTDQSISPDQSIGISVLPLTTTGTLKPLYAAYTTGSILDPASEARHLLALYVFAGGRWNDVQTIKLDDANYVDSGGVQQILIEPSHVWLEVQSGAGAHSGCYDLFAFDPVNRSVSQQISSCSSSPGAGYTADVNGDGQLDVVLDATEHYVFCYACGVTRPQYSVLAWDGKQLSEVKLSLLTDASATDLRQLNDEAVRLAQAGLWKDAQTNIAKAAALKSDDPVVKWNAALIELHAQAYQDQIKAESYPLLNNLFYGDYAAALDVLRAYPPDQIFSLTGPLIKGTVAEEWESTLANWITQTTNSAIQVQPKLAAAYFLRGLGEYLANAKDPAVLHDVEQAAQLAPDDKLFSDSLKFLK